MENMDLLVPNQSTLIKYNSPSIVPPPPPRPPSPINRAETIKQKPTSIVPTTEEACGASCPPKMTQQQLVCKDVVKKGLQLEEVLNILLPPNQWTADNGIEMRQTVSNKPATRLDVINLKEQLHMRLETRQARPKGVCLIRHELYAQCFDELIRQITINCPERGLLLLRIRDEIRMTQSAFRTLYETATAHVLKKEAEADEGIEELDKKLDDAIAERKQMLTTIQERKLQIEQVERRHLEFLEAEDRKFKQESEFLKRAYVQIQEQHDRIVNFNNKLR